MRKQTHVKPGTPPKDLIERGLKKNCLLCGHVQAVHGGANLSGTCLASTCYCGQFVEDIAALRAAFKRIEPGQPSKELLEGAMGKVCQHCGHSQAVHGGRNLIGRCLASTCYCGYFV
jgi:hypothetical protein